MPTRHTPPRRTDNRIIEELREAIAAGVPWIIPVKPPRGYSDLIYLVKGLYYICNFIHSSDDLEGALELWWQLREAIVREHFKREPGTRPWGFYALEDREPRRRLDVQPCTCPPGSTHPGLPPLSLSWFGHPRGCRCEYESEDEYLERHNLLRKKEREALREER
jgi:hypothetical protein